MTLRLLETLPSGIAPLDLKDAAGEKSSDSTLGDLCSMIQNLKAKLRALSGEEKAQLEEGKMAAEAKVAAARDEMRKYTEYLNGGK
ncbi:MAG: hypothetical protein LBD42_05655 [Desulfovibrio sp.]|jgi:hypothetical protein|nr:hypothetical protein [Desulfovibrio sp.]